MLRRSRTPRGGSAPVSLRSAPGLTRDARPSFPEARSERMARVRGRDTKLEWRFGGHFGLPGLRGWRCNVRSVVGVPILSGKDDGSQSLSTQRGGMGIPHAGLLVDYRGVGRKDRAE